MNEIPYTERESYAEALARQNRALAVDFRQSVYAKIRALDLHTKGSEIVRVLLENGGQGGVLDTIEYLGSMTRAQPLSGFNPHPDAIGIDARYISVLQQLARRKNIELKVVVNDFIHAIAKGTGFEPDDPSVLGRTRVVQIPDELVGLPNYSPVGSDLQWLTGSRVYLKKGRSFSEMRNPDPDKPFAFCTFSNPEVEQEPAVAFIRRLPIWQFASHN